MANVLVTTWMSKTGPHTVTTPRSQDSVELHRVAVAFWQGVFRRI